MENKLSGAYLSAHFINFMGSDVLAAGPADGVFRKREDFGFSEIVRIPKFSHEVSLEPGGIGSAGGFPRFHKTV